MTVRAHFDFLCYKPVEERQSRHNIETRKLKEEIASLKGVSPVSKAGSSVALSGSDGVVGANQDHKSGSNCTTGSKTHAPSSVEMSGGLHKQSGSQSSLGHAGHSVGSLGNLSDSYTGMALKKDDVCGHSPQCASADGSPAHSSSSCPLQLPRDKPWPKRATSGSGALSPSRTGSSSFSSSSATASAGLPATSGTSSHSAASSANSADSGLPPKP
jgi:hypothetical protein